MIKITYKPGKGISSSSNKNQYYQYYDWLDGELLYKGYFKNNKYIGYNELYRINKGIKYKI